MVKRRQRLNGKEQFRGIYRSGIRIETAWCAFLYRLNGRPHSRLAVVVRKSFGTAVDRNKVKRRARHLFHLFQEKVSPACDFLFFPKNEMLTQRHDALVDRLKQTLMQARLYKGHP